MPRRRNQTTEEPMSDVEITEPDEVEVATQEAAVAASTEGGDAPAANGATAKAPKREKHDLPEGYITAVGFANLLGKKVEEGGRGVETRPQMIYSYAKNIKTFPHTKHTDGRLIVPINEGLTWWDEKEGRKATRAAAAAAPAPTETPAE